MAFISITKSAFLIYILYKYSFSFTKYACDQRRYAFNEWQNFIHVVNLIHLVSTLADVMRT